MAEYRVEELASAAGVSVELVRSYQSKGLLPPPRHEGRAAYYGERHLARLGQILDLKARGYSLRAISGLLSRPQPEFAAPPGLGGLGTDTLVTVEDDGEALTLRQVAERARVPPSLLRSLEASGVLCPRRAGGVARYTTLDVQAVRMLLTLLGSGLPMEEFMRVARVQLEAVDEVACGAAELFLRYVREPLLQQGLPEAEAAERLAAGLRLMVHATTTLMTYNFGRMVLNAVQHEIETRGSPAEQAALRRLARRHLEDALGA